MHSETTPTEEPKEVDWSSDWTASLLAINGIHEISEQLQIRWKRNAPALAPSSLKPPRFEDHDLDWSVWLERFLLTGGTEASTCARVIVSSMEQALSTFDGDLGKIVWFRDVAALRRVAYADDRTRADAASLVLKTFKRLSGVSVQPELEQYMHLERLYSVVTQCMVSELYEENVAHANFLMRMTGGRFEDFTLMWSLENIRANASRADDHARETGSKIWKDLAAEYQSTADELFATLLDISAQSENTNDLDSNRRSFLAFLRLNFSRPVRRVNDYLRFTGYQRVLDVHWLRLAALVSEDRRVVANQVRQFILFVSSGQNYLNEKVLRCIFSGPSMPTLRPKIDPKRAAELRLASHSEESTRYEVTIDDALAEFLEDTI